MSIVSEPRLRRRLAAILFLLLRIFRFSLLVKRAID
jgi:hypothetical protein